MVKPSGVLSEFLMVPNFQLWLEFELWRDGGNSDNPTDDFFNMHVTLDDGRKYALNVWTIGAFTRLAAEAKSEPDCLSGAYMLPPDLFVDRMDRELLESVVVDMIETDQMRDGWLVDPDV